MFFKNDLRPSFAGAGAQNSKRADRKNDSFMFDSADDSANFGGFDDGAERRSNTHRKKKKLFKGSIKIGKYEIDKKVFAIGIAAIAAILIAAIVLVCVLIFRNPNITYQDNAYMVYSDSNGSYHLLANGELIDDVKFAGEVTLIPSADNSFAYVYDDTDDGIAMYILKGTKLKEVSGGKKAEEIITQATLEPGIVYKTEAGIYRIYSEKDGDDQIVKDTKLPDHFTISADAGTVAYTVKDSKSSDRLLYIYNDGRGEKAGTKTSSIPVAVSTYGDYIYLTRDKKSSLFVLDAKDDEIYEISGSNGFAYILETNIKGDQIIFCTEKDGVVNSYLCKYRHKKNDVIVDLGKNLVTSYKTDPSIVLYKDFAGVYFTAKTALEGLEFKEELSGESTVYLNNQYKAVTIDKDHAGRIDPDEKYFYYVDENILWQVDLKNRDEDAKKNDICDGFEDFTITEKGDIYFITDVEPKDMTFHKVSTDRQTIISGDAIAFSYYAYANRIYYAENEATNIFVASEDNEADVAKLGSKEITSLPYFTETIGKKCYAIVYNEDNDAYDVYYTSNGNKFKAIKKVNNCQSITIGENELSDLMPE